MWEAHVPFLGWEDPLEKEIATHSSILAWRIPTGTEEPGGATVHRVAKNWTQLGDFTFIMLNPETREFYFIFPYNTHPIKLLNLGCFYFSHVSKIAHFFSSAPIPSSKHTSFFTSDSLVAFYWSPFIHPWPHLNYHPVSSRFASLPGNHCS